RHVVPAEVSFGLHESVALAEQPDGSDRRLASERDLEIVVELEPVRRAAHISVSHRPGAASLVALPNGALGRGGHVASVFAGSFRLRTRPVGWRLALAIPLQNELAGLPHHGFDISLGALVRER